MRRRHQGGPASDAERGLFIFNYATSGVMAVVAIMKGSVPDGAHRSPVLAIDVAHIVLTSQAPVKVSGRAARLGGVVGCRVLRCRMPGGGSTTRMKVVPLAEAAPPLTGCSCVFR